MDRKSALRLLGLSDGFTKAQLDQAFRSKAFEHHPDRGGTPEAMKRLGEAKAFLLQPAVPNPRPGSPPRPSTSGAHATAEPSEPMDRVSFATVSFVLLIPVAVLAALIILTVVVVTNAG